MAASLRGHAGSFVLLVVLLLVTVSADEQHELIRVKRFEGDVARNVDNYDKDQPVGGLLQKNQVNANVIQPSQRDGLKQNPDGQMPALKKPELQGQGYKPVQEQKMPWKPLGGLPAARNEIPQGAQEQLNGKLAIPGAQRRDPIRPQSRTGQVRIIDFPACQDVVTALCAQNARGNNFAVLECLQNDKQNYENIPPTCQQVMIWAGISREGPTEVAVFNGIMNSEGYQTILRRHLLPVIENRFTHRFQQDNDSKHTSRSTREWMTENNVNWWPTPPESPDLNPIENMWSAMKKHIHKYVKPRTKEQLVDGIYQFWGTVTPELCNRYIDHLFNVMPIVIAKDGQATGM